MRANCFWKNLARSLCRSGVIPALVLFFWCSDPLFWVWARFWEPRPSSNKKPFRYSESSIYCEHFEKKKFPKISKNKKARQTLKIFDRAISSHLINFRFLPFSGHFRTRRHRVCGSSRSRKIWSNRRKKNRGDTSRGTDFISDRKKSLFRYIYITSKKHPPYGGLSPPPPCPSSLNIKPNG